MNKKSNPQIIRLVTQFSGVVGSLVLRVLGIQIVLLVLPVHTGDKRFNQ